MILAIYSGYLPCTRLILTTFSGRYVEEPGVCRSLVRYQSHPQSRFIRQKIALDLSDMLRSFTYDAVTSRPTYAATPTVKRKNLCEGFDSSGITW